LHVRLHRRKDRAQRGRRGGVPTEGRWDEERVRARFAQWVRGVCSRPHDDAWRDYQHEIALRHTRAKKNQTDGVESVPEVSLRYLIAFVFPITATMRWFLASRGHAADDVDGMHTAWFKAVVLHVCLWAQPYAPQVW
jgi:hypothetical protein